MSFKGKLVFVGMTDSGRVRPHNEDCIGTDLDIGLVVLADGMGGYKAGEVASAIAVQTVRERVAEGLKKAHKQETRNGGYAAETLLLRDAIERANEIIHQTAKSQPQCEGMGTTIVACLYYDNRVSIAHVGDSRLYRLRRDRFEQITLDHSLLQELVSRGFYTPEEARKSLNKNLVTRALGIEPTVQVEVQEDVVLTGDIHLLCSDGLSDMVEDADIHLTLSTFSANLEMAAKQLIQMANDNGGRDNISVILTQAVKPFEAKKGLFNRIVDWFA
ncbi:MAG TPA: Stp1/IreP family PP2C-type Ser/Thr phosphatase [Gammaproteobacteria bacterium]|nr:Stp1/IreP family PP2C-type Ser/Thr phosphatase [Gammaproteobacteria bacterium]